MSKALAATVSSLPDQLRRSLTWDRGKEMSQHAQFRIDTGVAVYFADPKSPWQRGTAGSWTGRCRRTARSCGRISTAPPLDASPTIRASTRRAPRAFGSTAVGRRARRVL